MVVGVQMVQEQLHLALLLATSTSTPTPPFHCLEKKIEKRSLRALEGSLMPHVPQWHLRHHTSPSTLGQEKTVSFSTWDTMA